MCQRLIDEANERGLADTFTSEGQLLQLSAQEVADQYHTSQLLSLADEWGLVDDMLDDDILAEVYIALLEDLSLFPPIVPVGPFESPKATQAGVLKALNDMGAYDLKAIRQQASLGPESTADEMLEYLEQTFDFQYRIIQLRHPNQEENT